jgi:hypothetical protein
MSFFSLAALNANNKICCDEIIKKFCEVIEEVTKFDNIVDELEKVNEKAEKNCKGVF